MILGTWFAYFSKVSSIVIGNACNLNKENPDKIFLLDMMWSFMVNIKPRDLKKGWTNATFTLLFKTMSDIILYSFALLKSRTIPVLRWGPLNPTSLATRSNFILKSSNSRAILSWIKIATTLNTDHVIGSYSTYFL